MQPLAGELINDLTLAGCDAIIKPIGYISVTRAGV